MASIALAYVVVLCTVKAHTCKGQGADSAANDADRGRTRALLPQVEHPQSVYPHASVAWCLSLSESSEEPPCFAQLDPAQINA